MSEIHSIYPTVAPRCCVNRWRHFKRIRKNADALDELEVSIRMIEKGGARINALIEQVHVFSERWKEYLSNEPVPIRPALGLSLTHLETYIEEQGLSLTLHFDADGDQRDLGKPGRSRADRREAHPECLAGTQDQQERSLRIGLVRGTPQ